VESPKTKEPTKEQLTVEIKSSKHKDLQAFSRVTYQTSGEA